MLIFTNRHHVVTPVVFREHFIEGCLHKLVQTETNIPSRHDKNFKKRKKKKTQHKICIKREQKQNKAADKFINIKREHDYLTVCFSDWATSLSASFSSTSHVITQIHFFLTNASVHTLSHRESNSAPVHIFRPQKNPIRHQAVRWWWVCLCCMRLHLLISLWFPHIF